MLTAEEYKRDIIKIAMMRPPAADVMSFIDRWGGSVFVPSIGHVCDGQEMVLLGGSTKYSTVLPFFRYLDPNYEPKDGYEAWGMHGEIRNLQISKAIKNVWSLDNPRFGASSYGNAYSPSYLTDIRLIKPYQPRPLTPKEQRNMLFRGLMDELAKILKDLEICQEAVAKYGNKSVLGEQVGNVLACIRVYLENLSQFTPIFSSKYYSNLKNKRIPCQIQGLTAKGFLVKFLSAKQYTSMDKSNYKTSLVVSNPVNELPYNYWTAVKEELVDVL